MTYRICKKLNIENDYKEIEQALEINNNIWNVKSSLIEFKSRAENSYLIALFEDDILQGTISGITLNKSDILNNKKYHTWDGVTRNGTFDNVDEDGDTLCCVAITSGLRLRHFDKLSVKQAQASDDAGGEYMGSPLPLWVDFVNKNIEKYLKSGLDPVINFHKKDKIVIDGAKVVKIFANGRPDDKESLGFNVLMQYPEITDELREKLLKSEINCEDMGVGKALILGALKEAIKNKKIKYIMPYSRPAKYGYYLKRAFIRLNGGDLGFDSDSERYFFEGIQNNGL